MPALAYRTALLILSIAIASTVTAADWMQFRGPGGQGVGEASNLPVTWSADENVAWKTKLPGAGSSSPIFVGDKIYITCFSGYNEPGQEGGEMSDLKRLLVCLNRADGKLLWSKEVPSKLPEQERIRDDHGYASSTPASDGKRIYAFFGKSGVFAFDLAGKQIWHADVGDGLNGWGSASSPVLYKNLVIINASVESDSLVALNANTGKEVWRQEGIRESWSTPIIVEVPGKKPELVVSIQRKVVAFEPGTGTPLWSCETEITSYMVPTLVTHNGQVFCIGGRTNGSMAVKSGGKGDVTDSHRMWVGKKGSNVPSPIYYEGHLYWAHDKLGIVYCANAETGEIVYEERLPRADQFYASPVLVDGKIYYVGRNGRTFVIAAKPEFELLATNDLGERSTFNASPAVADNRLFLRSDQHLYCLEAK